MKKYEKLDAVKFGIAGGIIVGVCVMLITFLAILGFFFGICSIN